MSGGLHFSSNGFIQFGDGEPIPCTDIRIEWKREPGRPRIIQGEVVRSALEAREPDPAELNVQEDGFYGGQDTT